MKKKLKLFLPALIIIVVTITISYYLVATKPKIESVEVIENSWQVNTIQAKPSIHRPSQQLFGKLNTENVINLSASVAAEVTHINIASGELVKVGQLMVGLDQQKLQNSLDKIQAKLTQTQLEIKQTKVNLTNQQKLLTYDNKLLDIQEGQFQRIKKLAKLDLRSVRDLETIEEAKLNREIAVVNRNKQITDLTINVAKLNARLKSERAELADVKLNLANSQIKAPTTGLVLNVFVQVGSHVGVHTKIAGILPIEPIEFEAVLLNRQMPQIFASLEAKQPIHASIKIFGEIHSARLHRLKGTPNLTGQIGVFQLDNVDERVLNKIRPNLNVPIEVQLVGIEESIAVPYSAIYGTDKVFVVREGRLVGTRVDYLGSVNILLQNQQELWALIKSATIKQGERIMTTHLPNASTGMKISVLKQR